MDATNQRWRLWLARLALAVLGPLLVVTLLDVGLRVGGYGYPTDFFLKVDADGTYETNYRFGWRFFPRALARGPHPSVIPPKQPGSTRIVVLGGSAALGTPEPAFSFGRMLEVMLRARYPDERIEVVNAAMTAINSHVVREIARDSMSLEPDLFIVYMGNNEVIGPYGPGTVFQRWTPGLAMTRFGIGVKATRVGQWMGNFIAGLLPESGAPRRWRGLEMFQHRTIAADDARLTAVYKNYQRNLSDICKMTQKAHVPVLLSTVAVNLKDFPPLASQHRAGLSANDQSRWDVAYTRGAALQAEQQWTQALASFEKAAAIDDQFAELAFRMGSCLLAAQRVPEARARFEQARDLDALRFRADSRINAIVREQANGAVSDAILLVDAEQSLAQAGTGVLSIAGQEHFFEHVHLNVDGNVALARTLLDPVCRAIPRLAAARPSGTLMSRQECAAALVLTAWDEAELASRMVALTASAPFNKQLDYAARQAAAVQQRDRLRHAASAPAAKTAIWNSYKQAIAASPDDWQLQYRFGQMAVAWDRPDHALDPLRSVLRALPWDPQKHAALGAALADVGRVDEAIAAYRKALEVMPSYVEARNSIGAVLWRAGRSEEAVVEFKNVLLTNPDHENVHNNLGSALVSSGRTDEAIPHYRKAIALKPDYTDAHKNLAIVLQNQGHVDEAIGHFEQALALRPDDAEMHYKLGLIRAGRGEVDAAIRRYRRAVEVNPEYGPVHNNLGSLLFPKGQTDAAMVHFRAAVRLLPESVDANANLGIALRSVGRVDEAAPYFRKAQALKLRQAPASR